MKLKVKLFAALAVMVVGVCGYFLLYLGISEAQENVVAVGASRPAQTWVYLCGLTAEFDGEQETARREMLDRVGKETSVRFLALVPTTRCEQYRTMLCWPHDTADEVRSTYDFIMKTVDDYEIDGLIGFSNGGFFLNRLIQETKLAVPVIVVGAYGHVYDTAIKNTLHLMVGTRDEHHYDGVLRFYQQTKDSLLDVTLYEFDGGHDIHEQTLREILQ